jgi:polyphosphate glucokinase
MLFLGLGTGLGAAMVEDDRVFGLEIAHLPFRDGSYEDSVGDRGLDRLGPKVWRKTVFEVVEMLSHAFIADYVMIGGGNVKKLDKLPPHCRRGANALAFEGGFRLWGEHAPLQQESGAARS